MFPENLLTTFRARGGRLVSGQLLIAITMAPTTAIRAHTSSLSPQRFNRLRMSELLSIITFERRQQGKCLYENRFIYALLSNAEEVESSDSAQVALRESGWGRRKT